MDDQRDRRGIEPYLDEIDRGLARLTVDERREWREEARGHLLALVEAHEELGASRDEAVEAALRQFGAPDRLAGGLTAGRRRERPMMTQTVAWALGALGWNLSIYTVVVSWEVSLQNQGGYFLQQGEVLGLGHVLSGVLLAHAMGGRLPGWARTVPFLPYLILNGLLIGFGFTQAYSQAQMLELAAGAAFSSTAILLALALAHHRRGPEIPDETGNAVVIA